MYLARGCHRKRQKAEQREKEARGPEEGPTFSIDILRILQVTAALGEIDDNLTG